ncbi:MAG: glycosyltransferase family 1 protein [Ferroplasma sp.]|uniref:glycosyltransferase family 4 protein n=1 Tax=Ferroplasma sp. TaxID=2591003 RepID=UPI002814CE16|nr:glycosyltransferase family 1 protein [Ferroplasma sp.]WMT50623.1 MAG: glycosyltransferase family 1 protein [Ferroplasma sp.]
MITYITVDSTVTGVGKYAYDVYNLLKPESEIIQIIFNKKFMDKYYSTPVMGTKYTALNYFMSKTIYRDIIKDVNSRDNIIHITSQTMKPIFKAKNMVVTIHDVIAMQKNIASNSIMEKIKNIYLRQYLHEYIKYENIITISNYVKSMILENFNINKNNITVISPYVSNNFNHIMDKHMLRKKHGLPENKKLILSVSSNQPRKNLGMVKKVMEGLGTDYKLVRIGSQVGDSITFHNVSQETVNEIYNACDILYFPTLMEGFGYPVVEAFKTGLPVVSSDIEVIREVASDAAILVNPNDLDQNIKAVKNALDNKENLIKKGYSVSDRYSPEVIRNKLIRYYNGIMEDAVRDKTN